MRIVPFLVLSFLPGCLAFGYPSSTYTPIIAVPESDAHAFKSTSGRGGTCMIMTGGQWRHSGIEKIPVVDGIVGGKEKSYLAYFVGGPLVSWSESWNWSVLLYRPGYEIIEVPSRCALAKLFHQKIDDLSWKPALDLDSQVKALERLSATRSMSEEVRQFVAGEYERLAETPLASTPQSRQALSQKADNVRSAKGSLPAIPVGFPHQSVE